MHKTNGRTASPRVYNRHYEKVGNEVKDITEEIDFDLPNGWEFTRINVLVYIQTGASFKKEQASNDKTKIRVLRGGNILNGLYSFFDNDLFIDRRLISDSILLRENDLLTPAVTSIENIGKLALINRNYDNVTAGGFVFIMRPFFSNLTFAKYLLYSLQSAYFNKQMKLITKKSGQAFYNLGKERLIKLILPIPPLAEQSRIVAEIEKYEPLIAEYDKLEQQKSKLDSEIYDKLKKSILQYAIQGKLVPQNENDEPASELLKRIRAEKKAQLGKKYVDSYIYKGDDNCYYEKIGNNEPVLLETLPFEIPNSWAWARLKDIVFNSGQKTPTKKFCYIDIGSIDNKRQKLNSMETIIDANEAPSRARKIVQYGDILYATVRPYLHNMCIVNRNFSYEAIASTGFAVMSCKKDIYNYFLFYYLLSPTFDQFANSSDNSKGVAYPAINDDNLYKALVPIPPNNEQIRIVEQIQVILTYIEKDEA